MLRETFVLHELLALEAMGATVTVFAFRGPKPGPVHEALRRLRGEIVYAPRPGAIMLPIWLLIGLVRWPRQVGSLMWLVIKSSWRQPLWLLKSLWTLAGSCYFAAEVMRRDIRHLHAHFAWMATLSAMAIAKLTSVTFSFTAHAHDIFLNKTLLKEKIQAALFVVTISEYNRKYLSNVLPDIDIQRIYVVHCGVDTSQFRPAEKREDKRIILSVGGLVDFKGFPYLIEACRILAQRKIDYQCRIIGDGKMCKVLEAQIAQAGLQKRVRLLGAMPIERVREQHSEATVYVQPSIRIATGLQDGIPVALMEAMASGLPVVATHVSGIPELVQDHETGLLVHAADAVAIADAVQQLFDDSALRNRLSSMGRRKVEAEFDLRTTAQEFAALLKAALDGEQ